MEFSDRIEDQADRIITLFAATFAASEGADEGAQIGMLVSNLLRDAKRDDTRVFTAFDSDALVGAVLFSRMVYDQDPRHVRLLSPMAVATGRHSQGIGQALINHALAELRAQGTDIALTYGSPVFYGKTGFQPITEDTAAAPLPLSFPHGWIGQSLTQAPLTPLQGTPTCVAALNDPQFW